MLTGVGCPATSPAAADEAAVGCTCFLLGFAHEIACRLVEESLTKRFLKVEGEKDLHQEAAVL